MFFFLLLRSLPGSTLFPYTTLFRSDLLVWEACATDPFQDQTLVAPAFTLGMAEVTEDQLLDPLTRSEEHTSELQSRGHLVCRLLLEKKNIYYLYDNTYACHTPSPSS